MTQDPTTVKRVILRAIQRLPGITRGQLSQQARPYGAEWTRYLQELLECGVVTERSRTNRGRPEYGTRSTMSRVYDLDPRVQESAPEFAATSLGQLESWLASVSSQVA